VKQANSLRLPMTCSPYTEQRIRGNDVQSNTLQDSLSNLQWALNTLEIELRSPGKAIHGARIQLSRALYDFLRELEKKRPMSLTRGSYFQNMSQSLIQQARTLLESAYVLHPT
jgi:hypothetical protein